jgi:polysaccharide export outer membrane protein
MTGLSLAQENSAYRVGPGDIISISVIGHEELRTIDEVNPDGSIAFPYLDSLMVEGKTIKEISEQLRMDLSPGFIQFPEVIVRLEDPKSQKFYVYGEVKNPGAFHLERGLTVLKAVSLAGGYTPFANRKRIKVLRPKEGESAYEGIIFDLDELVNNPAVNSDIYIHSGDVVAVLEK